MSKNLLPISLIITTYNDSEYLPQALDSVLDQNAIPAQVLVIDDGSKSDEACNIISDYQERISGIDFFKKENSGPSGARNYGIEKATQEYIAFLDVDDQLIKDDISKKYEALHSLSSDYFGVYGVYIDSRTKQAAKYGDFDGTPPTSLVGRREGIPGCVFSYLFRKEFLVKIGGFDENLTHNEDFDFLIRLLLEGYRCKGRIGVGVLRNYRPGSLTRNTKHFEVYNSVSKFLDKADANSYFEKTELERRRKNNNLTLAKKLSNSGYPTKEIKKILQKAFFHAKPERPKEYIAYILSKII